MIGLIIQSGEESSKSNGWTAKASTRRKSPSRVAAKVGWKCAVMREQAGATKATRLHSGGRRS